MCYHMKMCCYFPLSSCSTASQIQMSMKKQSAVTVIYDRKFGRINTFADITAENILAYDKFLHKGNSTDATVFSYHKRLKFYINQARSRCSRATEGREYGEGSA